MAVSVIIPLYNKARHIRRALDSVMAQTMQDFEVIVVDDGSTDGGGDVAREVSDSRIRLIAQENRGVSAARNRGIHEASFEQIAFLDADDEWLPSFLETVTGLRERHPEAGAFATAYRVCRGDTSTRPAFVGCVQSPDGGLLDDYFLAALGPEPVWTSAVMIPKHVFGQVGNFPVGVRRGEDVNMWERIALRYRVAWSPVEGAVYHLSADNRSCESRFESDVSAPSAVEQFLRSDGEALSPRWVLQEYLVRGRLPVVKDLSLHGMKPAARRLLKKTKGTAMFRRQRLLVQCAVLTPAPVLRLVLRMKCSINRLRK